MPENVAHPGSGKIIFVVATAAERRACLAGGRFSSAASGYGGNPEFIQAGMGLAGAYESIKLAAESGAAGLISIGTAAGLAPHLEPGSLLLPKRVNQLNGRIFDTHPDWHSRLHKVLSATMQVHTGDLLGVDQVIREVDRKRVLYTRSQAIAADMESGKLAGLAKSADVPFLVLRTVFDAASDEIPPAAIAGVSQSGDLNIIALSSALLKHPRNLHATFTILRRFRSAAHTLRQALAVGENALLDPGAGRPKID